jgi:hypothetical protein
MPFSLNYLDYPSVTDFIVALDSSISHKCQLMATAMALGIEHENIFQDVLEEYLLRFVYEVDYDASSLTTPGSTIPVTIPLTADMTFISSDAIQI